MKPTEDDLYDIVLICATIWLVLGTVGFILAVVWGVASAVAA